MNTKTPYRTIFRMTGLLTGLFPKGGARFLDRAVALSLGQRLLADRHMRKNRRILAGIGEFRRILVIGDLNIGDAVTLQAGVTALRDYFPAAEIEYVVNRFARPLVENNPEISRVWPVFTGTYFPESGDAQRIEEIVAGKNYDLIVNFCPSLRAERLPGARGKTIGYTALALRLIQGEHRPGAVNHIVYRTHRYIHDMLAPLREPQRERPFRGVNITVQDSALQRARDFLAYHEIRRDVPIVFYNPDASSPFTRIPYEQQEALLHGIVATGAVMLVGAGYTFKDIGMRLVAGLPPAVRRQVVIVPSLMPLDALAALIDFCDMFVSADTGPLHLAAARKVAQSGSYTFRNRTAVVSVFGATPAHMYGYDSSKPGFFPANQDAVSSCYVAGSRCRNITCINKAAKACRQVRCFEHLAVDDILADIHRHLDRVRRTHSRDRAAVGTLAV
jgi:ADP-heptose:LPS heptosyltransferase